MLLVTGLDLRSALAAQILAPRLAAQSGWPVELVVRRVGEDLDDAELVSLTGCEILGRVPTDRSVRQRDARGDDITRGRGSARRAVRLLAERVLAGLDENGQQEDSDLLVFVKALLPTNALPMSPWMEILHVLL